MQFSNGAKSIDSQLLFVPPIKPNQYNKFGVVNIIFLNPPPDYLLHCTENVWKTERIENNRSEATRSEAKQIKINSKKKTHVNGFKYNQQTNKHNKRN